MVQFCTLFLLTATRSFYEEDLDCGPDPSTPPASRMSARIRAVSLSRFEPFVSRVRSLERRRYIILRGTFFTVKVR
jgi:hypothetical protein